jgi:hypothetical protein
MERKWKHGVVMKDKEGKFPSPSVPMPGIELRATLSQMKHTPRPFRIFKF